MAGGKSQRLITPAECCTEHRQGRRGQKQELVLQEAEGFAPRGSKDSSCSGSVQAMSDPPAQRLLSVPRAKAVSTVDALSLSTHRD